MQAIRYLGIDPGTHCGYAVLDPAGNWITAGCWDLKPSRHEGGGMRWVRLERYLSEVTSSKWTYRVGYEEIRRHAGTDAAHVYGGIIATLQRFCEAAGIPYLGLPVGTVKKLATGKGNAAKELMISSARQHWPQAAILDDNVADALWIAETLRQSC